MKKKKREYWPYAIVLVLGLFMSGILYGVSIMVSQNVPMVAEDYYAQELVYQDQIDKEQRLIQDGKTPVIRVLKATSAVEVSYTGYENSHNNIEGKITFNRPSDPGQDFVVPVKAGADNLQWLSLPQVSKGLWVMQFDFKIDGSSYYYEEKIEL